MSARSFDVDVVVVGAGAAGIAASRHLWENEASVMLLEASQRIGGRAWTHDVEGLALDLGCGWLHSADHNIWASVAAERHIDIDRRQPAWERPQPHPHFSPEDQAQAHAAYDEWLERMRQPHASDHASEVLPEGGLWNAYVQAISGFMNGARLEHISIADYVAYDEASTTLNWRIPTGYGALVAGTLPGRVESWLATPLQRLRLASSGGVIVTTPRGELHARCVILTVSTDVLASDSMVLPKELEPWRDAAIQLPLGCDEKLFLSTDARAHLPRESIVLANPHDANSAVHYLYPLDKPVIECFVGGDAAQAVTAEGPAWAFAWAIDQLCDVFGNDVRRYVRPLVSSQWGNSSRIGGSYSHALPGSAAARGVLAQPFDKRIFFAGEATHRSAFSTAHGAYESGIRAAREALLALGG